MKYQIASAYSTKRLMANVQALINGGWAPLGGPMAVQIKEAGSMCISYEFSQAMVMDAPDPESPQ